MELMQNPTRREILQLVKRSGGMTVEEMSRAIGITPMGVRQHLAILERDGLIQMTKRRGGMGRPAHVYTLTEKGDELFPRTYDLFALTILDALEEMDGPEKVEAVLQRRTERLRESIAAHLTAEDVRERVQQLVRVQTENGYMADYEERPDGIVFRHYNCTIAQVARRYPVICRMEHRMFESLVGTRLERECCLVHGEKCCAYRVPAVALQQRVAAGR